MNHWLTLLHRYLGIAVGTLMAMWCVSGMVMMYVGYPVLQERHRVEALAPIDWTGCCKHPPTAFGDGERVSQLQIEMLAGQPTLAMDIWEHFRLIDLRTGVVLPHVSLGQAADVALRYVKGDIGTTVRALGSIDSDQWTVAGEFARDRPLYRFALDDAAGTEIYISSRTGKALQLTTAHERFWNWLGAIPHWLYFAGLRRNAHLWSQVVIATSLVGCFLVITGLYIGVRQFMLRAPGVWSPHRGLNLWHHLAGLIFGVLALTWVFSGLVSINPWGWLERAGARLERAKLRGDDPTAGQIKGALQSVTRTAPPSIKSLRMEPLDGHLYFVATQAGGGRQRIDGSGMPAPLGAADLSFVAGALGAGTAQRIPQLITHEDEYYFTHHGDAAPLPVYRLIVADVAAVRYYIDAVSGALLAKVDGGARAYRWLHEGLHRMDFVPALRRRPCWDVLMLLLLAGVTTLCGTGAVLGYRRVLRSARALR